MTILIRTLAIGGDEDYLDTLKSALLSSARCRFSITLSLQLEHALDVLQQEIFHLVILNQVHSDIGIESLQQFIKTVGDIPVIVHGDSPDDEIIQSYLEAGARDYVVQNEEPTTILPRVCFIAAERYQAQITSRKTTVQKINQGEEFFRAVIDASPNLIFLKDNSLRYNTINNAIEVLFCEKSETFIGSTTESVLNKMKSPIKTDLFDKADEEILSQMTTQVLENEKLTDITGSSRYFKVIKTPVQISDERIFLLGIAIDITSFKEAEENLRKREKEIKESNILLKSIIELSPSSIIFVDKDLKCRFTSNKTPILFHEKRTSQVGESVIDILAPSTYEMIKPYFDDARKGQAREYEIELSNKDKGTRYIQVSHVPHFNDNKVEGILTIFNDTSERKSSEKTLSRLTSAIDQVDESIVITDMNGNIQYVNPAFEHITGYSSDESIGVNVNILRSGKQDRAFYQELWDTLLSGETWSGRFINRKKDGTLFTEEATISPVRDSSGNIVSFVAVKRDISEVLMLEQQLRQAQKMESLGTLAGGIAHDFNNILTAILGFTELTLARVSDEDPLVSDLEEIYSASIRAKDLVHQILTFSRRIDQTLKPLDVSIVIKEALKLLRSTLPSTIKIRSNLSRRIGKVLADPTQIHQIIMNLCTNATHAIAGEVGELSVSLANCELPSTDFKGYSDISPGGYVEMIVKDTGSGIPSDLLPFIFDPYYTTKDQGEGTGLGLAVVHGIVKEYKGEISVETTVGLGTSFKILLPIIESDEPLLTNRQDSVYEKGEGEVVLVIDDERVITTLCRRLLEAAGYMVHTENSVTKALTFFKKKFNSIDLVISDMTMPLMTGDKLLDQMLDIKPGLWGILMSGNTSHLPELLKNRNNIELMAKPIEKYKILSLVRSLLIQSRDSR